MSQNRYQLPGEKNWTHEIKAKCARPVQDGVQTVKSHAMQNGFYFMYGTRIVTVLFSRTQIYISLLCFSFFFYYFFLSISLLFPWDLVCDRKHLKAMTETVYMGGRAVGWFGRLQCFVWSCSFWSQDRGFPQCLFPGKYSRAQERMTNDANVASENSRH